MQINSNILELVLGWDMFVWMFGLFFDYLKLVLWHDWHTNGLA